MSELTEVADFFRPNFWPNTPDILPSYLQADGRAAFIVRLVLAATLSSNYGIYGPSFELLENVARDPGSEEYLDSEKYQIRRWAKDQDGSLAPLISIVNRVRREHPALQHTDNVTFNDTDNETILCYTKQWGDDVIVCVVNLDPHHLQSAWIEVPIDELGIGEHQGYQVHDALTDRRFVWGGRHNYVELDPDGSPAHLFVVRRHVRTEHDFDYYL
jgi:starch synthase (maltosyl-transferring)